MKTGLRIALALLAFRVARTRARGGHPRPQAATLILWGARNRLIPPVNGDRFAADIAGSQLVVFEGLGHVPQEEDPAVAVVQRFLQR